MDSRHDRKSTLQIPDDVRNEDGEAPSLEEYIDFMCSDVGPVKVGNRWKARNMPYELFLDDKGRQIPVVNARPVPEDLLMPEDDEPDARLVIDWQK